MAGAAVLEVEVTVARHDEQIQNLVRWQEQQNGSLTRLAAAMEQLALQTRAEQQVEDKKIDALVKGVYDRLNCQNTVLNTKIDAQAAATTKRLETLYYWILGVFATALVSTGLLVLNMLRGVGNYWNRFGTCWENWSTQTPCATTAS
jgi:DNA anti-recombination protein RmuC